MAVPPQLSRPERRCSLFISIYSDDWLFPGNKAARNGAVENEIWGRIIICGCKTWAVASASLSAPAPGSLLNCALTRRQVRGAVFLANFSASHPGPILPNLIVVSNGPEKYTRSGEGTLQPWIYLSANLLSDIKSTAGSHLRMSTSILIYRRGPLSHSRRSFSFFSCWITAHKLPEWGVGAAAINGRFCRDCSFLLRRSQLNRQPTQFFSPPIKSDVDSSATEFYRRYIPLHHQSN